MYLNRSEDEIFDELSFVTQESFANRIEKYAANRNISLGVASRWFLCMLVNNEYVTKNNCPNLANKQSQRELFQKISLKGYDLYDVFTEYQDFRQEVMKKIDEQIRDDKTFRQIAEKDIYLANFIPLRNRIQLVDMLIYNVLQDIVDLNLNNLSNAKSSQFELESFVTCRLHI